MDYRIFVTNDEGIEIEMEVLFTFHSEEYGFNYVLFYDETEEEPQLYAYRYDEETNELDEIETVEEWDMVAGVYESYLAEHGMLDDEEK